MTAELVCFSQECRAHFPITEPIYNCPKCGALLEARYSGEHLPAPLLKTLWRGRRTSNAPLDQSGVWRYREMIPFLDNYDSVVTLREGNTPLLGAQGGRVRRPRLPDLQAPGIQSDGIVQG